MGYEIEIKIMPLVLNDSKKEVNIEKLDGVLKTLNALSLKP